MAWKNEGSLERSTRLILGGSLIAYGYSVSGTYWLGYKVALYPIPCWNWDNFIALSCMVERGLIFAAIGLIPLLTGLIGWCPLKAIFRTKK